MLNLSGPENIPDINAKFTRSELLNFQGPMMKSGLDESGTFDENEVQKIVGKVLDTDIAGVLETAHNFFRNPTSSYRVFGSGKVNISPESKPDDKPKPDKPEPHGTYSSGRGREHPPVS
jgi:hypothetical protein